VFPGTEFWQIKNILEKITAAASLTHVWRRVYFRPLKKCVVLPLAIVKRGWSYSLNI